MSEETKSSLELLDFDDPEQGLLAYAIHGKITAEAAAPIFDPVTKPDLRNFKTDQRDEALAWLRET